MTEAFLAGAMGRYGDAVYRLALCRLQNTADAEDVYQDTFLRLFQEGKADTIDDSVSERFEYQIELTDNSTKTAVKTFTKFTDIPDANVQMKEMVVEKTELGYTVTTTYVAPATSFFHVSLLDAQGNFLNRIPSGMPSRDENGVFTAVNTYTDIPSFEGLQFKLIGHDATHDSDKYGPYHILG